MGAGGCGKPLLAAPSPPAGAGVVDPLLLREEARALPCLLKPVAPCPSIYACHCFHLGRRWRLTTRRSAWAGTLWSRWPAAAVSLALGQQKQWRCTSAPGSRVELKPTACPAAAGDACTMSKQCGALSLPALAFAASPAGCSSPGLNSCVFPSPLPPSCRHPRGAGLQRRRPRRPVLCARAAPLPGREGGGAGAVPHHMARGGGHLLCRLLRLVRAGSDAFLRVDVPPPILRSRCSRWQLPASCLLVYCWVPAPGAAPRTAGRHPLLSALISNAPTYTPIPSCTITPAAACPGALASAVATTKPPFARWPSKRWPRLPGLRYAPVHMIRLLATHGVRRCHMRRHPGPHSCHPLPLSTP